MTRFKEITPIILLIQLLLVQCQWFGHDPYIPYGYPYAAVPPPYYGAPLPNQPEEVETLANRNQPNIIIIKDNDDKPTKKDKFRFEEILTLLLTTHLGRDRGREAPAAPQSNQGNCACCCCNCGCCCCKNRNNQNDNGKSSNGNGGGTTMHITIVLPNNSVNKNNSE